MALCSRCGLPRGSGSLNCFVMKTRLLIALITGTVWGATLEAAEWHGVATSFRVGSSLNARTESFRQASAAVTVDLPWKWDYESGWNVRTGWDTAAGWLRGEEQEAFVGSTGPVAELHWKQFPLYLDGGSCPTLLSRHRFGRRNYGANFQFTTHIGLNWEATERFHIGYRYQHMSNAGLAKPNPGLNLHMIACGFRF
jgi:hypothetical protein